MNGDEGIKQNTERGEGIEGEKMVERSEDRSRYSRSEKIKESPLVWVGSSPPST
jgi:hypothetical protein